MKKRQALLLCFSTVVLLVIIYSGCIGTNINQRGIVRGRVIEENGPLEGVRVEEGESVVFTDSSGTFLLENVPSGNQYLFFSLPGYTGAFVKVVVEKGTEVSIPPDGTISLLPESEESLYEYLASLYQYGFYERSLAEAEKFLAKYPGSPLVSNVIFMQGASYYYLGDYSSSINILSDLVNRYPSSDFADDGQYLLAKGLGQGLSRWSDAIQAYQKLIYNYPQSELVGIAYYETGDCYYILESYSNASVAYDQARSYGGEVEKKAIYGLAHCYYKLELYYKAASLFAEYIQKYPNDEFADDSQYFEGASWYRRENYSEALTAFDKSITNYPDGTWYNGILIAPASMFNKGLCLEKLGRYLEAYQTYLEIIRKYPGAKWADGTSLIYSAQFRINLLKDTVL
jgi:TolA-binding protein